MTSLCGPEPFISACTRRLSPFPLALPFFPFPLRITSAATHSSILHGSCMTHHGQTAPSPTSCGIPAWRAWDLLAWLLHCSKPTWERVPQARLALVQLSCPCTSPPPSPGAGTGLKWGKQHDAPSHIPTPDTSPKSRLVIKNSPLAWHALQASPTWLEVTPPDP